MYYLLKNSPKMTRHFKATAAMLEVHVYKLKKVHSTRFINHVRLGLESLLDDWVVMIMAIENSLARNKTTTTKLRGVLKKLKDISFLAKCCYFKSVLDILAPLSLVFEKVPPIMIKIYITPTNVIYF